MNTAFSSAQTPTHITLQDPIFDTLASLATAAGVDCYVVGGYVRDMILGNARKDIDCTVVGDALLFAQKVARHFGVKPVVYERFRTALVPIHGYQIEFVGTRKEEYTPTSRKPIVTEGTFEDDLRRRDFTVNALAVALNGERKGELIDLFNGVEDMRRKLLRTPLNPEITFAEDPLRMMRAARFASQLGFTLDSEARTAITAMAGRLSIISQERISDEFLKIMASPKPSIGLDILFTTGLLQIAFREVHNLAGVELIQSGKQAYAHKDVFYHTLKVVDNIADMTENVWLRYAALTHDIAKPKTKRFVEGTGWTFHGHEELGARWQDSIFRRMKFPLQHLEYVKTLIRLHQRPMVLVDDGVTDSAVRRLAVQAGEYLADLFTLVRADITTKNPHLAQRYLRNYDIVEKKINDVAERDQLRAFQSPVRGEEIMELCQLQPSRAVGFIKHAIEEAILDGIIPNDYDAAKEYLLQHKSDWMEECTRLGYMRNSHSVE